MQAAHVSVTERAFDVEKARADFPALQQHVYDRPLVYLDNAASAQKPRAVIDRLQTFYSREYSNVHRGVHLLSQEATQAYEDARTRVASYINAATPREVIFTRGTTESINLVASTFGRSNVREGDEVVLSAMEHHSNIVPWQIVCEEKGAKLRVIPVSDDGELDYDAFEGLLNERTRLVAVTHVSNALGTVNPIERIIRDAHAAGIPVLVDGAQAVSHMPVDVRALDADFYCFSGHKLFGPTGIGVLYGKEDRLDAMPPYQGGGDMIDTVTFERTTFNELPHKFEAGTPNIAGAIGLAAAMSYVTDTGLDAIAGYEHELVDYALTRLREVEGLRFIGNAAARAGVISFLLEGVHPYDAGTILDRLGIAVRTGHHCTQPLMQRFGIPGTVRASFAFYNTVQEVDVLAEGLQRVKAMFS